MLALVDADSLPPSASPAAKHVNAGIRQINGLALQFNPGSGVTAPATSDIEENAVFLDLMRTPKRDVRQKWRKRKAIMTYKV
jgi:hypothetical protein